MECLFRRNFIGLYEDEENPQTAEESNTNQQIDKMHSVYYRNFLSFCPSTRVYIGLSSLKKTQNSVIDQVG